MFDKKRECLTDNGGIHLTGNDVKIADTGTYWHSSCSGEEHYLHSKGVCINRLN